MTVLTEQERDAMAHAIGHHSAKGCSVHGGRNYYATSADDPMWLSLAERGLAFRGAHDASEAIFHLTTDGIAAVEADSRSKKRGRLYAVRFRGHDHGVQVYAESRGKAKYLAVQGLLDAWNMTASEAFRLIAECKAEPHARRGGV